MMILNLLITVQFEVILTLLKELQNGNTTMKRKIINVQNNHLNPLISQ